ncbi:molybdopterin oxidoreductase [Pleomorphomonas carboxyditropha]|uniref:Molybdopterin oxidoreductase n=2 Tax=Pleomorphomonas carboxyditropha TaxID=2023338 RepID=A0A2G9X1T5_9HYPH|nr:molybdopterin oxidoreductase [Pleomorphomonas carboxyditropha]
MARVVHAIQCIGCPIGCGGEVAVEDGVVAAMTGFTCNKGLAYAAEEVVAPKRMVTTTVRVSGGGLPLLPVVSATPVPKERIFDCLRLLRGVAVEAPVAEGAIIVADALGLGVDFRATRDISLAQ